MGSGHGGWVEKALTVVVVSLMTVSIVAAQAQPGQNRGRIHNQGGAPLKKARPEAGDPLAKADGADAKGKAKAAGAGTYHYTFKLHSFDGSPLAASHYPSKLGSTAPVVMLVHEANRSRKDFEEAVTELKGLGLAEHLQEEGYAVFSMDLRGQGQNPRRVLSASDRPLLAEDLQAAYFFLLDRHNRGDFNVAKLGMIAVGEGANLAVAWAYQPGAAVSTEGRPSDLNALVLISPYPAGSGYVLGHILPSLAPRIPLALLAGSKDNASKDAVESVRRLVERARLNKVELFPSSLHGYKLMRLEPKVTPAIMRFLEPTIKLRPIDWEPRYNLTPVTVSEIQTVRHTQAPEKPAAKKGQAKAVEAPKPKEADAAGKPGEADEKKKPEE
ncbi:MAG: alpha/beta hydrolase [Planctomycetaceae bacterium]|nr:alpha/beta hydrolase [Planctomycetaceae bacterium]